MSKATLYYVDGRGRAEAIRWLLAACDIEFDEVFLKTKDDFQQLKHDGLLLFQQVPMLEIDGMKLCQVAAILRYVARKGNKYGSTAKEQALIDMYTEGLQDMNLTCMYMPFKPKEERDEFWNGEKKKMLNRYLPVFEKALAESSTSYLASTPTASMADVLLVMVLIHLTEIDDNILEGFPTLKKWLMDRKKADCIAKFLQPGSKRKPPPGEDYAPRVKAIFYN